MIARFYVRFVTWALERFYHEAAWTYDAVAWVVSRGYWRRWIEAVVPLTQGQPLLELGCGTGYLQRARITDSALTVGLDESLPMLRLARRKAQRTAIQQRLVRAIGQQLPFVDAQWPIVVATFPAPYLFDSRTLSEIKRVLTPGGRLLIVDGGIVPPGLHRHLIELLYRLVFGATSSDRDSQAQHDPRVLRLEQAGFSTQTRWLTVGDSQVQLLTAQVA